MGVKSTRDISRSHAESLYVDYSLKKRLEALKRELRAQAVVMDNEELENALERLNDENNDGEGFENYLIDYNYE